MGLLFGAGSQITVLDLNLHSGFAEIQGYLVPTTGQVRSVL
jgi:hypothetical protein